MALTYSKYLNVSHRVLVSKGVYNGALDQDYELHIDPILLRTCSIPEFKGAYEEFISYFERFVTLTPLVKENSLSDRAYRQMFNYFHFPERANTGLGYSKESTRGRGISGALSRQLTDSAIEIINAGFKDPAVFALLPLFEDNIGADRISDMVIAILFRRFIQYTNRITSELKIQSMGFTDNGEKYELPVYQKRPIVFIPMSILTDLPRALDYDDIERVCNYNKRLKSRIAEQIGLSWAEYTSLKKREWKDLFIKNPKLINDVLEKYNSLVGVGYDFAQDDAKKYADAWLNEVVNEYPLRFLESISYTECSIFDTTMAILSQFKSLVENNYMWKIFKRKGRSSDETDWQLYLFSIADTYIKASKADIDITRENNPGVGELDFKFTRGTKGKTVVEIKRSSNENLLHGYVTQLPLYMKSEGADAGILVIIKEDDMNDLAINTVYDTKESLSAAGKYAPEIVLINADPKPSASIPLHDI